MSEIFFFSLCYSEGHCSTDQPDVQWNPATVKGLGAGCWGLGAGGWGWGLELGAGVMDV